MRTDRVRKHDYLLPVNVNYIILLISIGNSLSRPEVTMVVRG
jgi:hypothetical protein